MNTGNFHDKIFKEIQKVKENAADFIQGMFPPAITELLDLDSLEDDV